MLKNNHFITKNNPGLPIPYYRVSDITLEKNVDNLRKFYGDYFILEIPTFQYFHIINEKIGQYELLKDIIPGLKLICVADSKDDFNKDKHRDIHYNLLDMLSIYDIFEDDIIYLDSVSIWIENIFYFNTRINKYLISLDLPKGRELFYDHLNHNKIHVDAFRKVQSLYQKFLCEKQEYPTKIFITRRGINNNVRHLYGLLTNKDNLSQEDAEYLSLWINNYGGEKYLWQLIRERYISENDEDRLENYFISKNYTVIDPADMTFINQINHYYNATHVVSVRGSGLVNTIFCKQNAKVFILDVTNEYDFEYKEIVRVATEYVYEIPVKRNEIKRYSKQIFSVENIIALIDNHYLDKI